MTEKVKQRLGEALIERKLITPSILSAALSEHRVSHERLGRILVRQGFLTQGALARVLRELNADELFADEYYSNRVPAQVLIDTQSMVVAETADAVCVGTLSPQHIARKALEPHLGGLALEFVPFRRARLQEYLAELRRQSQGGGGLLERLLADSVRYEYSDLHIVPKSNTYVVLARHLGVRSVIHEGPLDEYAKLAAQVKDRSKMDIAERRLPQDGAFSYAMNGRSVDFRVATVPTVQGEYLVLRVLDPENAQRSLESLGITRLAEWRAGVGRPDGLCLICGPTGSGKTTTLSATVREMDRFGSAIFTAEDPVEYQMPYIGQVNINPNIGLTFDRALKAFMRADPDIIVLGEIRDMETAKAAIKMGETGHLVLATLHTESIPGAVQRLQDIGVPKYELSYLLRTVLVQRLMRTVCPACHGQGCAACRHNCYTSRTIVSECAYFPGSADVTALLEGQVTWPTMLDDAYGKVVSGVTDEREFLRIFQTEAAHKLKTAARS